MQHLGRYLEGQGHSITLQPKSCLAHFTTISQNLEMLVIVLGDFNKIPHASSDILTPVINVSTTNTRATWDEVFVSEDKHLSTLYFSDHQIIWIEVNLQSLESS